MVYNGLTFAPSVVLALPSAIWRPPLPVQRPTSRAGGCATVVRCALRVPLPGGLPALSVAVAPALGYAVYLPYIFYFSAAHGTEHALHPAVLAGLLSLNFDFVLPLMLPSVAPTLNPVLEALFNATVAYATLLVGFVTDVPGIARHAGGEAGFGVDTTAPLPSLDNIEAKRRTFAPDTTITFLLLPFLTNIVWLPYLALRGGASDKAPRPDPPRLLVRVAQSGALPLYALAVVLAAVVYGAAARASPALPADVLARVRELARLCREDVLAASFAADWAVFAATQGWLVADDAALRSWTGTRADRAAAAARFVPFFGLVWYMLERARDPRATRL
jgi:hypothetical protein